MNDHLSLADLNRFARGAVSAEEACRTIEHLLAGCSHCALRLEALLEVAEGVGRTSGELGLGQAAPDYDVALDRAFVRVAEKLPTIEDERRRIAQALPALRARGLRELQADPLLAGLIGISLVEALLTVSFELRFEDPERMLELTQMARDFAGGLAAAAHGAPHVADCQGRALAEHANSLRIHERMSEAREAFRLAERRLAEGTGDPQLAARVATLKATLLSALRELPEAFELYDHAARIYRELGDVHAVGRTLVQRGICSYHAGDARSSLSQLRQGYALLDPERDPQLVTAACQSLIEVLSHCGEHAEAARLLLASGLRRKITGAPINRLKLRWTEGRVLAGLGKLKQAERAFRQTREEFLEHGQRHSAAHVGLDLAAVRLELGQAESVRELASETLALFRESGSHHEAERALTYLHRACEQQEVTPALLRRIGRFLDLLERDPRLRFEAPV